MPLYRQAKEWRRLGIELSTSTMGDWVAAAIDLLKPLWRFARADTLGRGLISLDDTHLPVLDRDHPNGIKKGHLWTYIGQFDQVLFCEYTPTWEGEGFAGF
jgi:transposase